MIRHNRVDPYYETNLLCSLLLLFRTARRSPYLRAMLTRSSFLLTGPAHGRAFEADATYRADGRAKPVLVFVHGFKGLRTGGISRCWPVFLPSAALSS